jgi:hypothetical protein
LRASLEAAKSRRGARAASGNGSGTKGRDGDLDELSVDELRERAKRAEIKGRSKMSKDQLVRALHDSDS